MKKVLAVIIGFFMALTFALPASAEAPLMAWDATGIKNAKYVDIQCYTKDGPWSTWRSPTLPLAGSWEYKSSGSPGIYPDYTGTVQCYVTAYLKNKKIAYPDPVLWTFTP